MNEESLLPNLKKPIRQPKSKGFGNLTGINLVKKGIATVVALSVLGGGYYLADASQIKLSDFKGFNLSKAVDSLENSGKKINEAINTTYYDLTNVVRDVGLAYTASAYNMGGDINETFYGIAVYTKKGFSEIVKVPKVITSSYMSVIESAGDVLSDSSEKLAKVNIVGFLDSQLKNKDVNVPESDYVAAVSESENTLIEGTKNIAVKIFNSVNNFFASLFDVDNTSVTVDDVVENPVTVTSTTTQQVSSQNLSQNSSQNQSQNTGSVVQAVNNYYSSTGVTPLEFSRELSVLRADLELKIRNAQRAAEIAIGNTRSYVDRSAQNVTNNTTVIQQGGSSDAGSLTGATLAANVLSSSLTSLGTIANLNATAASVGSLAITGLTNTVLAVDGSGNVVATTTGGGGGSGTVSSGLAGQVPYYAANGTTLTGTSSVFISSNQSVGIGTTTPISKLSVVGPTAGDLFSVRAEVSGGSKFSVYNNLVEVGTGHTLRVGRAESNAYVDIFTETSGGLNSFIRARTGRDLYLGGNNGTQLSLIDSSRAFFSVTNFGIGTSSPSNRLEVNGSGYFSGRLTAGNITATGTMSVGFNGLSSGRVLQVGGGSTSGGSLGLVRDDLTTSVDETLGMISFGSTDGSVTHAGGISMYAAENFSGSVNGSYMGLSTTPIGSDSSVTRIYISHDGNIGMGTSSPSNRLEVAGSGYFAGNLTAGNITATGTLSLLGLSNTVLAVDSSGNVVATTTGGGGSGTVSSGLTGQIPYYASNGTTLTATSTIFFNNGNVGIGTSTPSSQFHVYGSSAGIRLIRTTSQPFILLSNPDESSGGQIRGLDTAAGILFTAPNGGEWARFNSSGSLGIGTTSPSGLLAIENTGSGHSFVVNDEVNDSSPFVINAGGQVTIGGFVTGGNNELAIQSGLGGETDMIMLRTDSNIGAGEVLGNIWFGGTDGNRYNSAALQVYADESFGFSNAGSYMTFGTTNVGSSSQSEKIRITSSGDFGVGTTSPAAKLDVWGSLQVGTSSTPAFSVNTATNIISIGSSIINATGAGSAGITMDSAGRTAIQTQGAAINSALSLRNSTVTSGSGTQINFRNGSVNMAEINGVVDGNTNNSYLGFNTRGSNTIGERMRINSVGDLLIGTTTTSGRLSVVGAAGDTTSNLFSVASTSGDGYLTVRGNGKVAFGNNSAFASTHFQFNGINGESASPIVTIARNDSGTGATEQLGSLYFGSTDSSVYNAAGFLAIADESFTGTVQGTSLSIRTSLIGESSPTELIRLSSNGNVGIGTSSPYAKLSVMQTVGGSTPLFSVASSTSGASTSTAFLIDAYGRINMGVDEFMFNQYPNHRLFVNGRTLVATGTTALPGYSFVGNEGTGMYMPASRTLGLIAFGQELINMSGLTGRVGIGTSSPSSKLGVAGDGYFSGDLTAGNITATGALSSVGTITTDGNFRATGNGVIGRSSGIGSWNLQVFGASGSSIRAMRDDSTIITDERLGSYTFGGVDSNVIDAVSINAYAAQDFTGSVNGAYLNFRTTSIGTSTSEERMRITDAGFVGIGTTSPSAKLSVTGTSGSTNDIFTVASSTEVKVFTISSSGNVGIGTTSPTSKLVVSSSDNQANFVRQSASSNQYTEFIFSTGAQRSWTIGQRGTDSTGLYFNSNAAGTNNDFYINGSTRRSGFGATTTPSAILSVAGASQSSATDLFNVSSSTGSSFLIVKGTGSVGIGTSNPQQLLHVYRSTDGPPVRFEDSNGYCEIDPTNTSWTCTSDRNLKKDISNISSNDILSKFSQLQAVSFRWNNQESDDLRYGLIAQDVEVVFPELVTTSATGIKSVSYGGFTPFMIEAIKSLNLSVSDLKNRVASVEARVGVIEGLVSAGVSAVQNAVASFTFVIADIITTKELKIGDINNVAASGITIIDRGTGQPACMYVENGVLTSRPGECGAVNENNTNAIIPDNTNNNNAINTPTITPTASTTTSTTNSTTTDSSNTSTSTEPVIGEPVNENNDTATTTGDVIETQDDNEVETVVETPSEPEPEHEQEEVAIPDTPETVE